VRTSTALIAIGDEVLAGAREVAPSPTPPGRRGQEAAASAVAPQQFVAAIGP
jgi:hypothetical protein